MKEEKTKQTECMKEKEHTGTDCEHFPTKSKVKIQPH